MHVDEILKLRIRIVGSFEHSTPKEKMEKTAYAAAQCVSRPIAHTIIAFYTEAERTYAVLALKGMGFPDSSIVKYSAEAMAARVNLNVNDAGLPADFGDEIDLMRIRGDLAKKGCSFLLVDARTNCLSEQVAELVRLIRRTTAQHCGHLIIEEAQQLPPVPQRIGAAPLPF